MLLSTERIITYLTIAVVVVGALALISNNVLVNEQFYEDINSYREAKSSDEINAMALPDCAHAISVSLKRNSIKSVSFTCTDEQKRKEFISSIKKDFEWNIFTFEGGKVILEFAEAR